jgi:hypothetical protein
MMRLFSSRRESMTADVRGRAARFERQYGRAPSQRELARLAQESNFATRAAKTGTLDLAQAHAGWADTLTHTLGVSLASVAPSVWHDPGARRASADVRGPGGPCAGPGQLAVGRAAQKAVALAQRDKSVWTRADVIKYLGRVLPRTGMDPAAAAAPLEEVADRALASEFEPVACLEAPEPAEVPTSLRRADGRSVYQRHGGVRYATHAQLTLEQRMVALACASGAPRLYRAEAARALGADLAQLEAALAGRARDWHDARTRTGLRTDQAAAALSVLTDGRRVSVIDAPAGSGKTWVLAAAGQAWAAAGRGRVVGITPSQSARNTLAAGVSECYNTAQFLGHLPGARGARGPIQLHLGDVVLMDEASMVSNPDLADVVSQAASSGAKVILAGDTQQLQAVENGGGLRLLADPAPGPRPAPELARYDRIAAQHAAQQAAGTETKDALAVLAGVLDRDGQQPSASGTRQQARANADHLAILHAIWTDQVTAARDQYYRELLAALLPPEHRHEPGHQVRWLWRTLRAAELAGLDAAEVLAAAIGERDLAGARDVAAVIDARLRYRLGALVPAPSGPWSAQVPFIPDPERRAYVTEIAALMDARKDRIGEHAAQNLLPWAIAALGPVPEDPSDRMDWQRRAAAVGAWRELSGHCDPADPIGPEPVAAAPDLRAAWHEALAALGPADAPDVRGMPDGRLLHLRDTYPMETAWAPAWVGDELRQVRAAAWEARLAGLRAAAGAAAARHRGDAGTAARQQKLAASCHALHEAYRQREIIFAATMADRADWDAATRAQRQLAVAADAELRRRHPGQPCPPLRSAEPEPATEGRRAELTLTATEPSPEIGQWLMDLATAHRTFAQRLADRQSVTIPAEDPRYGDLGQAFPQWPGPGRDAILQPPKPEIQPSPQVLERAADRDTDWEAAD